MSEVVIMLDLNILSLQAKNQTSVTPQKKPLKPTAGQQLQHNITVLPLRFG